MIKALISIASVTAIALSGLAYAETNPAKDNKILGFVQLGKTTDKQLTANLKKKKCTVKKARNVRGEIIYQTDSKCYKLYGDPIITFVTNAMGTIVEAHISFYSGPNYENWDYYRMDLLGLYGSKQPVSGGYYFWDSGDISIALFPKSDLNGDHKSSIIYKYEGSTSIAPSSETRNLL